VLQSFIDQDYDGGYEIIVVDGGPTDETIKS
jgi:glycosyltransferase involved in cell wall biosynthesis